LHRRASTNDPRKSSLIFYLLDQATSFEFERAFSNRAGENNPELFKANGKREKLVSAGFAGSEGNRSIAGPRESDKNDIIANPMHFAQGIKSVTGAVANAIQVEENRILKTQRPANGSED